MDIDFQTQVGVRSHPDIIADAHNLPFKDSSFVLTRCWHVLEHCRNPEKVIGEVKRVSAHASFKFPVDDGFRYGVSALVSLHPKEVYRYILTRKKKAHLWIIRPRNGERNSLEWFWYLKQGRKGRFFKRFPFPYLPWAWEWQVET